MKNIVILTFVAIGLGACSSTPMTTAALGEGDVTSLDSSITPKEETSRLIKMMSRIKRSHHRDALVEIGAR